MSADTRPGKGGRLRGWRAPVAGGMLAAVLIGGVSGAEGQFPPHIPFLGDRTPTAGQITPTAGPATQGRERQVTATPQDVIAHPGRYFKREVVVLKPFTNSNAVPSSDNPGPISYTNNAGQPDSLNGVSGTLYSKSSFEGPSMPAIMSPGIEDNLYSAAEGEDGRGKLPTISVEVVQLPDGEYAAKIIKAVPVFPKNFHWGNS